MTAHPLAPAAAGLLLASSLPAQATIVLQTLTDAVTAPMYAAATAADPAHLYIAERDGTVRRVDRTSGALEATPFLDIRSQVNTGGEGGLLGIAFDPAYASNGHFYVNYLDNSQQTRVVRYTAAGGVIDPGSAQTVIAIDQPQLNHNGGWIGFGPDHRLYVATGDGGGANDNFPGHTGGIGNAQDLSSPLGKILRLDVDSDAFPADPGRNYAIPTDNPLLGGSATPSEIWAFGLRNPFRAGFDRLTGDLWIGDVGQNAREEIDFQPAGTGGQDYGWRLREGTIATPTGGVGGPNPDAVDPVHEYDHTVGASVIGGTVYRGSIAELYGRYFFADFISDRLWTLDGNGAVTDWTGLLTAIGAPVIGIVGFSEDADGELYLMDLGGAIYRIAEIPAPGVAALLLAGLGLLHGQAAARTGRPSCKGQPDGKALRLSEGRENVESGRSRRSEFA